jgi:hypothetical protein
MHEGFATGPNSLPEPKTSPAARVRRRSSSKDKAGDAWAVWKSTGSEASAAHFYAAVTAWTQGTAAQLLRPLWPVGIRRPTTAEVESRLRVKLSRLSGQSDYLGALRIARDQVVEEMYEARNRSREAPAR